MIKFSKTVALSAIAASLGLAGVGFASAQANANDHTGFYLGVGGGLSHYQEYQGNGGSGSQPTITHKVKNGFGTRLFMGYQFSRHFGLEFDSMAFEKGVFFSDKHGLVGLAGDVVFPVADKFRVYGKVGVGGMKMKIDNAWTSGDTRYTYKQKNAIGVLFGAGVAYALTQHVDLVADYTGMYAKVDYSKSGISGLASVGVSYRF